MEYRQTLPKDNGFDDEDDEYDGMRGFIQTMMRKSGPADLLDTLLVVANICEHRALLNQEHRDLFIWYTNTGMLMRGALEVLAQTQKLPCPQHQLENPMLYFPDVEHSH